MARTVHFGILSARFFYDAKAYIDAAEVLVRESYLGLPTYFLLSHALELTIKSYLAACGLNESELKKQHNIERSFDKAVELGLRVDGDRISELIQSISMFHEAYVFRYPVINRDKELVVIRTLVKADQLLEGIAAIWRQIEPHAIHARLLAANEGGKYPVDYWHMGKKAD